MNTNDTLEQTVPKNGLGRLDFATNYEVRFSLEKGRGLFATEKIPAGSPIMIERPFVIGPKQSSCPVCVECLCILDEENASTCDKCGISLCKTSCLYRKRLQGTLVHFMSEVTIIERYPSGSGAIGMRTEPQIAQRIFRGSIFGNEC